MASGKKNRRKQQPPTRRPGPAQEGSTMSPPSSPLAPTPPPDEKERLDNSIRALEKARGGSRVLVYWTTDMARVSEAVILSLYDQLTAIGKTEKLDLFLYTRGGDTEAPWRIVSLIREFCDQFAVLVPHRASSAGTLIAMGADEIVMSPLGILGPIDPSRTHPLLPRREGAPEAEPISVQDMRHAMQFIREAAGPEKEMPYTPEAMATIFSALFEKIHPLAIGAIEQSYALSKLIATQCLRTHMNPEEDSAKIQAIVDKLCDDYKSHLYQISREEAAEIGLNVIKPNDGVEKAMMELFRLYVGRTFFPSKQPTTGQPYQAYIAWLDSTDLHLRVEAQQVLDEQGKMTSLSDQWVSY